MESDSTDAEASKKLAYFTDLENFLKQYPWSFSAYDPLNRAIPADH